MGGGGERGKMANRATNHVEQGVPAVPYPKSPSSDPTTDMVWGLAFVSCLHRGRLPIFVLCCLFCTPLPSMYSQMCALAPC